MPRTSGCPMNVRDWVIEVASRTSTSSSITWLRVKGATTVTRATTSTTEDGSAADALWTENYVAKRSGTLSIEARKISDAVTGTRDAGQAELDYYATLGGCDADAKIRLTDPYGHCMIIDVIVTGTNESAQETTGTVTWDMEQVGEAEIVPYVQATAVNVTGTGITGSTATVAMGATISATVAFTPTTASNKKYSVASADTSKVRIANIDGLNFDIVPVAVTTSAVDVLVKTMNNQLTKTIAVSVTST